MHLTVKSPLLKGAFKRLKYVLSYVKQITSPGSMHEAGCSGRCTGMTQRDRVGREVGGGFGMGDTCAPMLDSGQCMAKATTIL